MLSHNFPRFALYICSAVASQNFFGGQNFKGLSQRWRSGGEAPSRIFADEYYEYPLTNICSFSTKNIKFFALFLKNIPLFNAKISSICNRNLDLD